MNRPARLLTFSSLVALLVMSAPSGLAGADTFRENFIAFAVADAVRIVEVVPNGPVTSTPIDSGGPSSASRLDSLGESRAYASFPYLGQTVSNGPGLVRGAAGIPVPDYPLYAASFHPSAPSQEMNAGPYFIKAESTEAGSRATAILGPQPGGDATAGSSQSQTAVDSSADSVTAVATSLVTGFAAGPLRIGQVRSSAEVSIGPDGALARRAELSTVGVAVDKTEVKLTAEGIVVGDQAGQSPDTSAALTALEQAGINVAVSASQDTPAGVAAPTVVVTTQDPAGNTTTVTLGGASASITTAGTPTEAPAEEPAGTSPSSPDQAASPVMPPSGEAVPNLSEAAEAVAASIDLASGPALLPEALPATGPTVVGSSRSATSLPSAGRAAVAATVPQTRLVTPAAHSKAMAKAGLLTAMIDGGDVRPLLSVVLGALAIGLLGVATQSLRLVRR